MGGVTDGFEVVDMVTESKTQGGEIQIDNIMLQVVAGDITQEKTEAIVNGTNKDLDLTMGMY